MGEWTYSSNNSLTSALDGFQWSASRPGRCTFGEITLGTRCFGSWMGPTADLDKVEKREQDLPRPWQVSESGRRARSPTWLSCPGSLFLELVRWKCFP